MRLQVVFHAINSNEERVLATAAVFPISSRYARKMPSVPSACSASKENDPKWRPHGKPGRRATCAPLALKYPEL